MPTRVPPYLKDFRIYIVNVDVHLKTYEPGGLVRRGELLGMTADEINTLSEFKMRWTSGDPGNPGIWDLHSNPLTKSRYTRAEAVRLMKDFTVFFSPILRRISGSPMISPGDRLTLRIAESGGRRRRHIMPIENKCLATARPMGGGIVRLSFRTTMDAKRPCRHPLSEGIEIAYRIDAAGHERGPDGQWIRMPKEILAGPDDNTKRFISSKAATLLNLGFENAGSRLQFFACWCSIRHPELNGPWTGPFEVVIA